MILRDFEIGISEQGNVRMEKTKKKNSRMPSKL